MEGPPPLWFKLGFYLMLGLAYVALTAGVVAGSTWIIAKVWISAGGCA